jgi:hypothetical protein
VEFFMTHGAVWEVRAQLCTDLEQMPIENAAMVWPEEMSPFRRVGRIKVEPQLAWSEARSLAVDDGMSFAPWHGLAAHRPLGGIMRARKAADEAAGKFRAEKNGRVIQEPRGWCLLRSEYACATSLSAKISLRDKGMRRPLPRHMAPGPLYD